MYAWKQSVCRIDDVRMHVNVNVRTLPLASNPKAPKYTARTHTPRAPRYAHRLFQVGPAGS